MAKGGLLKTLRPYKTSLIMLALLIIIVFSIFNTKKEKQIENLENKGKKVLEITLFSDSSNNALLNHHVIHAFGELKSKYEEDSNVIIKQHNIKEYIPWFLTEKTWGPMVKASMEKEKKSQEEIFKDALNGAPILTISVLDKTKGDNVAKGAERYIKGFAMKGSSIQDVNNLKSAIPGTMVLEKIGETPFDKTK